MRETLTLTRDDLIGALAGLAARPGIDRAIAARAEGLARALGPGARVIRRGGADYAVAVAGAADPGVVAAIVRAAKSAP
jgi:hypothetical protein